MSKRAPPQFRKNTSTKEKSLQENALGISQIRFWEIFYFDWDAINFAGMFKIFARIDQLYAREGSK